MASHIRTALLVTLVALLIWLWAEGESLSTMSLTPRVALVQDRPDLSMKMSDDWHGSVRLRIEGSTRALNDAERELGSQIRLKLGQPGVPAEPGAQVINFEEAIRQLTEVANKGITVVEVDPRSTIVHITKLVSREIPVKVSVAPDVELVKDPVVSPTKIVVRMPETLAARLTSDVVITAPISKTDLASGREEGAQSLVVPIRLPGPLLGEDGVAPATDKVTVSVLLKRSVESFVLASVPVWLATPPTESSKWDVEILDQFLRDVTFIGPADAIAKIRNREVVPIAEVRLSSDDLEKGVESKESVILGMPAGVDPSVASKTVRLKITKRKSATEETPDNLKSPDRNTDAR